MIDSLFLINLLCKRNAVLPDYLIMGVILNSNCINCRKSSEIFHMLDEDDLRQVNEQKVSIQYNPGEVIFKQGAPAHNFVCVTSGLVNLYLENENNPNLVIGLIRPVNYIFEPGFFLTSTIILRQWP